MSRLVLDVNEVANYIARELEKENKIVDKNILLKILDLETQYMIDHGFIEQE